MPTVSLLFSSVDFWAMLDTVAAILSAVAALVSSMIGGKVYFDSRKGPDIQLIERPVSIGRAQAPVNMSMSGRLIFVNIGSQRGALVSVSVPRFVGSRGNVSIVVHNSASFPAVVEPSSATFAELGLDLHANRDIADMFQEFNDTIAIRVIYEVTTKSNTIERRTGRYILTLV